MMRPAGAPVVVVGGGAAGLELVTRLSRHRAVGPLVLVDRALGHLWKPRLHEIAAAMQNRTALESSFLQHANDHGYRFEIGAMTDIDAVARTITLGDVTAPDGSLVLPGRQIAYSTAVLAVGSEENDFGTPGARANCLFLNTPEQAAAIRDALLSATMRLARGLLQTLSIVIIGGGATGVELVAEIRHALDELWVHEPGLDRARVHLTVVDAAERLLSANPVQLSEYAARTLKDIDVDLVLGQRVESVDETGVVLVGGARVDAQLKIWTAGIRGPRVFESMHGLPRLHSGRLPVDSMLQCPGFPGLYAIGDCAEWLDPASGRAAPYTAQIAAAQAKYLARALVARTRGRTTAPFRFKSAGSFVSLGKAGATGNLTTRFGQHSREQFVQGLSAKAVYALLQWEHELAVHGLRRALARLLAGWLSETYEPTIKLH